MKKSLVNTFKFNKQYLPVFAMALLVLLSSCAVKGGIKSLLIFPNSIQQTATKSMQFVGSFTADTCNSIENTTAKITQTFSVESNALLPILLLATALIFLSGALLLRTPSHPGYGNLKISGTLPIFLQYQKLII